MISFRLRVRPTLSYYRIMVKAGPSLAAAVIYHIKLRGYPVSKGSLIALVAKDRVLNYLHHITVIYRGGRFGR